MELLVIILVPYLKQEECVKKNFSGLIKVTPMEFLGTIFVPAETLH
jgi:hypothetical protein